jgi:N utilization substance protein B
MTKKKTHLEEINNTPIDAELEQAEQVAEQESVEQAPIIGTPFTVGSRRDERVFAFNLVYAADRFDYSISLPQIVESFVTGFEVIVAEDSFAIKLAQDVIDNRESLDAEVMPFLRNWKIERLGCCTRLILRMAVCEMRQPGAIPSIIINEAVELAKTFSEKDAYRFVNGILDEIAKKRKAESEDQRGEQS